MFRKFRTRLLLMMLLLALWWWLRRPTEQETVQPSQEEIIIPTAPPEKAPQPGEAAPKTAPPRARKTTPKAHPTADDFTRIKGIGPKITKVLQAAGIETFAQLAGMECAQISEILRDAGVRVVQVESWPAQARIAASGDWSALKKYQS